jgi:hypothetical protein
MGSGSGRDSIFLQQILDKVDSPSRPVKLIPQNLVSGANSITKTAVDTAS